MIRHTLYAFLLAALGAAAEPVVTLVDGPGDVGQFSSVVSTGSNVFVSYYDADNGDLKLASCTTLCDRTDAHWTVTTVDSAGNVGLDTSAALGSDGNPQIAYYDVTNKALKLATCTAGCTTASPTWVVTTVDGSGGDTGRYASLVGGGNTMIAYYDMANGDLKLATCIAACATATPTWAISTVDSAGDVGRFAVMRTDFTGRVFIAYEDASNSRIKLAICTTACTGSSPSWIFAVVDGLNGTIDTRFSMALNEGAPTISYYEPVGGELRVAICNGACTSSTPNWTISQVDTVGDAGRWSAVVLNGSVPAVAYSAIIVNCNGSLCHELDELRFAVCAPDCSTSAPKWVVSTIDNTGRAGLSAPSMVRTGDTVWISYFDALGRDLKLANAHMDGILALPQNYTSLWWDPEESGWGINFSHQGDIVFGTLFTYDASGQPRWLVMSAGRKQAVNVFAGELYQTTGPAFNSQPFTPIGPGNITQIGTMAVEFAGDSASLTYSVNDATVHKTLRKQVFAGDRAPRCQNVTSGSNTSGSFQDLWWNPNESGWGINFAHQADILFATLFTYDASGRDAWFVMSAGRKQADGSYAGELYRTSGPAFNAVPFSPIGGSQIVQVGTMQVRFGDPQNGTLVYSVNGTTVSKAITRQVFGTPVPLCGS